jgi:MFS family permease
VADWRWIFYVNVPIGVVAFVLAWRLLPRGGAGRRGHVDVGGVLLLGAGALALLLPLVQAESGGLSRLWWLFPIGVAVLAAFVAWEQRVVRRGGEPVFDPRLVTETRGYGLGAALGTVYFVGFSGIWLVFALFFQTGLGLSPLESGLAVTPFALGSAIAAVVAGRLVERFGRLLTVIGLVGVLTGLGATVAVLLLVPVGDVPWAVAPALFVGGLGGGCVISPNFTMTLREVPVRMAGAAGGGLQTAQRFGAVIGTAALPGLFYVVLGASGEDYPAAAAAGLAVALAGVAAALVLAVVDLRRSRRQDAADADREESNSDAVHGHAHAAHS